VRQQQVVSALPLARFAVLNAGCEIAIAVLQVACDPWLIEGSPLPYLITKPTAAAAAAAAAAVWMSVKDFGKDCELLLQQVKDR
jgi:hypothetical protein